MRSLGGSTRSCLGSVKSAEQCPGQVAGEGRPRAASDRRPRQLISQSVQFWNYRLSTNKPEILRELTRTKVCKFCTLHVGRYCFNSIIRPVHHRSDGKPMRSEIHRFSFRFHATGPSRARRAAMASARRPAPGRYVSETFAQREAARRPPPMLGSAEQRL